MMTATWWIARKEIAQMTHSQRGLTRLLIFSGLLSAFSLLMVSNAELSLLDNAQVVYLTAGTILAAGALLAVMLGSDAFAGEKERGTLLPLLCAPLPPGTLHAGKAMGMLASWGIMYLTAVPYLWAVGADGQNLGAALFYLALFGTPVVLGFGHLTMALSAKTGSVMASLLSMVTVLMLAASPLVIGPGLRGTIVGQILDALNPFACALNTFDSVIIDSDPFSVQLSRLALVIAWLLLTRFAARRYAGNPNFQ